VRALTLVSPRQIRRAGSILAILAAYSSRSLRTDSIKAAAIAHLEPDTPRDLGRLDRPIEREAVTREILHKGTLSQEIHRETAPNDLLSSIYQGGVFCEHTRKDSVFKVCVFCV